MKKKTVTILSAQVINSNSQSSSYRVEDYLEGILNVDVTVVSGTTPTLVITAETSEDGTTWSFNSIVVDKERQGDLTRITAPTDEAKITTVSKHVHWLRNLSKFMRLSWVVTGASASFTVTAKMTLW